MSKKEKKPRYFVPSRRVKQRVILPVSGGVLLIRDNPTAFTDDLDIAYLCQSPLAEEVIQDDAVDDVAVDVAVTPADIEDAEQSGSLDERIAAAIELLDPDNPEHFTKGGKPQVKAIEAILGDVIDAADRDRVWDTFGDAEG